MKLKFKTVFWAIAVVLAVVDFQPVMAQDRGNATYYSNRLHGRRVSDGSRYHKDSLTCAHKTYPLGSILKVRNPRNGSEVLVKVTDRGPFRPGAIVDLSMAAAKEIGIVQAGVAAVEVTPVSIGSNLKASEPMKLPELELLDKESGNYYSISEWNRRNQEKKAQARKVEAERAKARLARAKQPRWRVVNGKQTAKSDVKKAGYQLIFGGKKATR